MFIKLPYIAVLMAAVAIGAPTIPPMERNTTSEGSNSTWTFVRYHSEDCTVPPNIDIRPKYEHVESGKCQSLTATKTCSLKLFPPLPVRPTLLQNCDITYFSGPDCTPDGTSHRHPFPEAHRISRIDPNSKLFKPEIDGYCSPDMRYPDKNSECAKSFIANCTAVPHDEAIETAYENYKEAMAITTKEDQKLYDDLAEKLDHDLENQPGGYDAETQSEDVKSDLEKMANVVETLKKDTELNRKIYWVDAYMELKWALADQAEMDKKKNGIKTAVEKRETDEHSSHLPNAGNKPIGN